MRRNITPQRNFKTGRLKSTALKTTRKKTSSSLANNYELVLQLYCLNKKQAIKKELKCEKLPSVTASQTETKPVFSITAWIVPFFTANFSFMKKVRQGISLVTE